MTLTVLLLENVANSAAESFAAQGFEVIRKVKLTAEDEEELLPRIHAICVRSKTKLTPEFLDKAKNLMVVGCFCIGTDGHALEAAAGVRASSSCHPPTRVPNEAPTNGRAGGQVGGAGGG